MRAVLQAGFCFAPARKQLCLQRVKGLAVIVLLQVAQLVGNHVIDALRRRLDQQWVEGNDACCRATAPGTLHFSQAYWRYFPVCPGCETANPFKTGSEMLPGLLPVPLIQPVAYSLCPGVCHDDPNPPIDEVYATAFTGLRDELQGVILSEEKMHLTADMAVHRPLVLPCPCLDQETGYAGYFLLQGLVDGAPAHAARGNDPQAAVVIQLKVDSACDRRPMLNLVLNELLIVLKRFGLQHVFTDPFSLPGCTVRPLCGSTALSSFSSLPSSHRS